MKIIRRDRNPFKSTDDDRNNDYIVCEKRTIRKQEIRKTETSAYLASNETMIIRHTKAVIEVRRIQTHTPISTVTWKGKVLQADDTFLRIELTKIDGDQDTKISLYNREKLETLIEGRSLCKGDRFIWTFETYLNDEGNKVTENHFQLLPQSLSSTEEQIEKHKKRIQRILKMLSEDENR